MSTKILLCSELGFSEGDWPVRALASSVDKPTTELREKVLEQGWAWWEMAAHWGEPFERKVYGSSPLCLLATVK